MASPQPKSEPLWSKASQDSKARLDHFFSTGKYSSDSDNETISPIGSSLSSTSKAAIICQSLRRRSLPSDEDTDTDEDLPDLAPRPFENLQIKTSTNTLLQTNHKSKFVDVASKSQKTCTSSSDKWQDKEDSRESIYFADEDLPDLAPRPCANLKLQIKTSTNTPLHTNHKSKIVDVASKSQKTCTSFSDKWQDKEDCRESKYFASKPEAIPLIKAKTLSPLFVAEKIVQTNDLKETKRDRKWYAESETSKNVPHPTLCDWTNICRPSPPLSPAHVRKKLFASPERDTSEVSRPWTPFIKEEVVFSGNAKEILSPNASGSCDETGFGLIKRKEPDWTTGNFASTPDFQHLECHSYARRELDMCGKRKMDETNASDTEDDEPAFASCATHVADEEMFTMLYRQFVKRRRQAVKSWKECNKCQSLHSTYNSPRSLPNFNNLHCLQSTSDSKPTPALAPKLPPTSDPVEVVTISDSDDEAMIVEISKRDADSDKDTIILGTSIQDEDSDEETMILGTSTRDEDSDNETLILETFSREGGSDDDTMLIEVSSEDEDSNDRLQKPMINATKSQRMIFDPNEVINISDDDTTELDSSLESDVVEDTMSTAIGDHAKAKFLNFKSAESALENSATHTKSEAPNFVGVLTTPIKEPTTFGNKDDAREAFRLLKSPRTEPNAKGLQERKPRGSRGVTSSTPIKNYTPVKNNLITKYFQSSPKNETNIMANDSPCSKKVQRPSTTDVVPKRVHFQEPSLHVGSHSDLQMMEVDSEDEFVVRLKDTRSKPRSFQAMQPVCKEVPNLNHGIERLVYNCLEAKGLYLPLGLQLVYDCCTPRVKPSHGLVAHLLTTWQGAEKAIEVQQCYSVLTNLQRRYQILGDHDLWCYLNKAASVLETSSDLVQVEANSRLVDFLTRSMEQNLELTMACCTKGATATNHCTTLVYKCLNPMMESARIRAVSQWMTNCVIRNHSGSVAGRLSLFLHCLSRLLEMAIKVCTNQRKCSKSMANTFCSMYAQLTLWEHRRALVDLVQPALLQSIFLATLLEDRASRLRISKNCTTKYLAQRLSVEKITNYFFLMGPLSPDRCSETYSNIPLRHTEEHFEEQLFLQFYLLKSYLEACEEPVRSSELSSLFEARKALQNLEAQCYHDCPDLYRCIPFQQTLACLRLVFV